MEKGQKIRYTQNYLNKLEEIFAESDYVLRYEKGNFKSGYCLLKDTKIAIVNKFFPIEGKVNSLIDIIKEIEIDRNESKHLFPRHAVQTRFIDALQRSNADVKKIRKLTV